MRIVDYNKTLVEALKDCKTIYDEIQFEDFDDEQLAKFNKINKLNQLQKDMLYLYAQTNNITEIGRLYKVSPVFVRKQLNKIYDILK